LKPPFILKEAATRLVLVAAPFISKTTVLVNKTRWWKAMKAFEK
jgi:hypothetical protein